MPRVIASATLAYLCFIAYQSLAGGGLGTCLSPLVQQAAHLSASDGLANFAAYLPLGLLVAAWGASCRSRAFLATLLGLLSVILFSLSMELLQACLPGRVSSWYDWLTNSLGALLGVLLMPAVRRSAAAARRHSVFRWLPGSRLLWPAALCVGAWFAMTTWPWRFTLDPGTIRANLSFVAHVQVWLAPDPWRLAQHLCGWLAIGGVLRAWLPQPRIAVRTLVVLIGTSALAQALLEGRALSPEELTAMALAGAAFAVISPLLSDVVLARLLPIAALAAVAAYELAPGIDSGFAPGMSWWPLLGRGGLLAALGLSLLYCWLAFTLVLSLRWRALHGGHIGPRRFALPLAVVAALLAMEIAQRWIPGRSPDTSAPLITGLAFLVAWALTRTPVTNRVRATSHRHAA